MERLCQGGWPIHVPVPEKIVTWLPCSLAVASNVHEQAKKILDNPQLQRFFDASQYRFARNEMHVMVDGAVQRLDRLVAFDDGLWILDYKRQCLDTEKQDYLSQLESYRAAIAPIYPEQTINAGLILSDGRWLALL